MAVMLSVMVMGAGAAFSDQDKIENTEAVDACSALNIIGGYPDGSYKPEGNIKRSEICKMICVALNGGEEPTLGTPATPTFSDVRNTPNAAWAEKYIESCVSQGIVSGVGIYLAVLAIISFISSSTLIWQIHKAAQIDPAKIIRSE